MFQASNIKPLTNGKCYNPAVNMSKIAAFYSDQPEDAWIAGQLPQNRSRLGQVFTPYSIAKLMAGWVSAHHSPASVLDPALGLGIFLRALLEYQPDPVPRMTGYEIDPSIAGQARTLFADNGIDYLQIKLSSFLTSTWESKYDAVLCNPPYRKFRGLPGKDELVEQVKINTGIKISKTANLYTFFLIKGAHQLADGGRAAFIIPYEFLNADYGRVVKKFLLDQGFLRKVLILGKEIQPFSDVITTTCIVCLERTKTKSPPDVQICRSMEELKEAINSTPQECSAKGRLFSTSLPTQSAQEKWWVPSTLHHTPNPHLLVPLSTFGRVMRGIATGDNQYFLLTEARRVQLELDEACVFPCLSKSSLATDYVFSQAHFTELLRRNKPVWLFNAQGNEHFPAVKKYMAEGVVCGADQKYLTKNRSPWYILENRPAAPLLATTFSRDGIRWVRNTAGVRFLTAFHGFYPHHAADLDLLNAYLITPLAQQILAQNQREYGRGLHKFEPNDLNHGLVVDVSTMPGGDQDIAKEIYLALIDANRKKPDSGSLLTELNAIFTRLLQ